MATSIRFAVAACLAFVLLACGASTTQQGSAPVATDPDTGVQTQTVEGLTIALEAPKAPKLLDGVSFLITLTDQSGKAVEGADVYLNLTMPAMPMGTNKPVASAEGPGKYRAQGVFDMAGDWEVTVHATVAGKEHVATFASKVAEKQ